MRVLLHQQDRHAGRERGDDAKISATSSGARPMLGSSSSSSFGRPSARVRLPASAAARRTAYRPAVRAFPQDREHAVDALEVLLHAIAGACRRRAQVVLDRDRPEDLPALRHLADAGPHPPVRLSRVKSSPDSARCRRSRGCTPEMVRNRVVLPAPLAPTTPAARPGPPRSMPVRAWMRP